MSSYFRINFTILNIAGTKRVPEERTTSFSGNPTIEYVKKTLHSQWRHSKARITKVARISENEYFAQYHEG